MNLKADMKGFSLIEMSIVLLLISALAALIVSGLSLLGTSKVHTAAEETQKYLQSVQLFKQQFSALPGDFTGATARWAAVDAATANGNGDGSIATATEGFAAWHHLKLSGILAGNRFNGAAGSLTPDLNIAGSKAYKDGGFQLAGGVSIFGTLLGNVLLLGKNNSNTDMTYGLLLARDAEALDRKLDDSLAASGIMWAAAGKENGAAACTDKLWNGALPAAYSLMDKTGLCFMAFRLNNDSY